MKHRLSALFLLALFLVVPAGVLSAEIWDDPDFLARLTASYGVRGDREPSVTREEQNILREVATHMPENPRDAAALLDAALGSGSSAALDFTLGNLRFQLAAFHQAEGHYRDAIRKFPDFLRAHKNLGLVLVRLDEHAEALAALSRALTLGSADGDTYGLIGFAHLHLEHWVSAEAACRQALLFQGENRNWQIGLIQALQAQDRHAETAGLLTEMTARWPGQPDLWTYQANTYIAMDEPEKAAANLELVRRMGALGEQGLLLLADIYVNQNLPALVLSVFADAFQSGMTVPVGRVVRAAERLSQQGHLTEAVQLVTFMEEYPPADLSPQEEGQLRRLQARLAIADERSDEAQRLLKEALEINPLDGESLLLLAKEVAQGDLEHAEVLLDQAARLPETAPQALRQHGELLVQVGRYQEALESLREAEALQTSAPLRQYIERIEHLARASDV